MYVFAVKVQGPTDPTPRVVLECTELAVARRTAAAYRRPQDGVSSWAEMVRDEAPSHQRTTPMQASAS